MIQKLIYRQMLTNVGKFGFGSGHHGPAPQKLERVEKKLIYLFVRNNDNVYEKVPAYEGQSLLNSILRMRVKSFETNICDGYDPTYRPHIRPHDPFSEGPQCGGCRVVLEDNWFNRVDKQTDGMSEQEKYILKETQPDLQSNTRLACCVPIEAWMNGMTLRVDPQPTEGSIAELH